MKTSALRNWLREERQAANVAWFGLEKCPKCSEIGRGIAPCYQNAESFECENGHTWHNGATWQFVDQAIVVELAQLRDL